MWFGVVMALNLSIGTITPPVALNLYVAANLADIPMERISESHYSLFHCPGCFASDHNLYPLALTMVSQTFGSALTGLCFADDCERP